jgi:hypothetical protein
MGICCTREEDKKAIDVPPSTILNTPHTPITSHQINTPQSDVYYTSNLINKNFSYNVKYKSRENK